jgi:nuclease S1
MIKRMLLLVAFQLAPADAWVWGQEGHSIIAEIAQREMESDAREAVDELLGHASLASVASWADDVKLHRSSGDEALALCECSAR